MQEKYQHILEERGDVTGALLSGFISAMDLSFILFRAPFACLYGVLTERDVTFRFSYGNNVVAYGPTEKQRREHADAASHQD